MRAIPKTVTPLDLDRIERALRDHPSEEIPDSRVSRRAAVAAVLRRRGPASEVLLIRRSEHEGDPWSGHMAFPGGRHELDDRSLLHTAVRETQEELGLDLEADARLLGRIDDVEAIARGRRVGMAIAPFFFELTGAEEPNLTLNREVAEVVWAPLAPLFGGSADTVRPYQREGVSWDLPAYDVEGRIVWGLTYQMLQSFFGLLRNRFDKP